MDLKTLLGGDAGGYLLSIDGVYDSTKFLETSQSEVENIKTAYIGQNPILPVDAFPEARQNNTPIIFNNGIDDIFVLCGGRTTSYKTDLWFYNIKTKTWTQKTSSPVISMGASVVYYNNGVNNLMVLCGGRNSSGTVISDTWEYNLDTDVWTQKISLATARFYHGALYYHNGVNNIMIIHGGGTTTDSKETFEYNLDTDVWTQKASVPLTSNSFQAFQFVFYNNGVNNLGFVHSRSGVSGFWEYNLDTDVWTRKAEPLEALYGGISVISKLGSEDVVITIGGNLANGSCSLGVYAYVISTNTWETLPQVTEAINHSFGVPYIENGNNKILYFGGLNSIGVALNSMRSYDIEKAIEIKNAKLLIARIN